MTIRTDVIASLEKNGITWDKDMDKILNWFISSINKLNED